jgi:hypothetical protein
MPWIAETASPEFGVMSQKSKRRQTASVPEKFTKPGRFGWRAYFCLTLGILLAISLIWYASQGPSKSAHLNLGDGLEETLETISQTNSNRQLKQLSDEAFGLFPGLSPDEKVIAWQVLSAIAVRRQDIAKDESQRLEAIHDELVAKQSIVNLSQAAPTRLLPSLSRLEQVASDHRSSKDSAVARQAISSLILVTSIRYAQSPGDSEAVKRVVELLRSMDEAVVPDAAFVQTLEICLEAFSQQGSGDAAEQIAIQLETQFGQSKDLKLAQWANLIREQQWLRSRQIVELLTQASTGDANAFAKIRATAVELIQRNPSLFGIRRAAELAQFLENLNQIANAKEIHEAIQNLAVSRATPAELDRIKASSDKALKRLDLIGRTLNLPAALTPDPTAGRSVSVVQFVDRHSPITEVRNALVNWSRFSAFGCRVFVAGPELSDKELVSAFGDLADKISLLSQSEARKLAEQCFLPQPPFSVVFEGGMLTLSGAPSDRLANWLETNLLGKTPDK